MNNETKEVLSALLAGRTYIFSLLHTLLGAEPSQQLTAAATGEASRQAVDLFAQDDAQAPKLLAAVLDLLSEADLDALKGEYTRLFLGPQDYIAAPWESTYTTKERALFQESTLDVRLWFKGVNPFSFPPKLALRLFLMKYRMAFTMCFLFTYIFDRV